MGSKQRTLRDLCVHQAKDLHYAGRHLGKLLPKMAKAASADGLREALERRQDEAGLQIDRLDIVFEVLERSRTASPARRWTGSSQKPRP